MTIKKHLFISANAELLPRWVQAFPKATSLKSGVTTRKKVDFVWLRVQHSALNSELEQQIKTLREQIGSAALIILSDVPNDEEAMQAFANAARGYCNSHAAPEVLQQVATVVEQGGLWIGESLMARLLVGIQQLPANPSPAVVKAEPVLQTTSTEQATWQSKLTEREIEVAQAIATGASNKEVARQLAITERTVKAHASGLFIKLNVQDRLQLVLKIRGI